MFKQDNEDALPAWLSSMYPNDGVGAPEALICPDDSSRGTEGGRPDWFASVANVAQFSETDDSLNGDATAAALTPGSPIPSQTDIDNAAKLRTARNKDIKGSSYMYEFSAVWCSWWSNTQEDRPGHKWADFNNDGTVSWAEAKQTEMKGQYWDAANNKIASNPDEAWADGVPIVRCFWHAQPGHFLNKEETINLAYGGYIYPSTTEGDGWKNHLRGSH